MGVAAGMAAAAVVGAGATMYAGKKASDATRDASNSAIASTEAGVSQARKDINSLFPSAQENANKGFQGALDVFSQSLPAQTNLFQQGNVGAQQAILQGLPQIQNALLGGNVDFSQMQPFQAKQPNLSFFNQELPMVSNPSDNAWKGGAPLNLAGWGNGGISGTGLPVGGGIAVSANPLSGRYNSNFLKGGR